jgi:FkbM family methyltransferase
MNHFFDVGANTGQTFDKFLLNTNDYDGCKIWCFEPSPRNMNGLVETAKRVSGWAEKGVHDFDVVVCPFGLWDKAGTLGFYEKSDALDPYGRENGEGDSFKENWITNNKAGYKIYASVVSTSQFILDNTSADDRITIKLDCEGGEYKILEDLLKNSDVMRRIQKIFIEWHTTDEEYKKQGLIDAFKEAGVTVELWPY